MTMSHETFRELLDEATGDAPLAPPVTRDVAAGRSRLRRRRAGVAGLAAAAVVAVAAGGALASGPGTTERSTEIATEGPAPTLTPTEPTVLQDVIDSAYPLPGDAQLRNIRVQTFVYGWSLEQCGGAAPPAESTADRFEQALLPSLDLIREKGFVEPTVEYDRGLRKGCLPVDEITAQASAWTAWRNLLGPWLDHAESVREDPSLVAPREDMAACLREATGLEISDRDPVDSVFSAGDGDTDRRRELAVAFADCGEDYVGRFEALLRADRTAYVEEHRALLERFARQLTAMGYVP